MRLFIDQVTDMRMGSVNDQQPSGWNAKIIDGKIKIDGDDPSCGVYFVNAGTSGRIKAEAARGE
ncbi:MAG: DUF4469 domain-containing protein [Treponema sp.]|nr:DUF4469 domain-containing protein [Treponema sp.]